MTNAEYRAHPAISRSDLFKLTKSPQHFRYEMDHPSPKTPSLIFGAALHKWVLEPDDFESEFVVAPNVNRRTKEGRAYWEMFLADNEGKEIISEEDAAMIDEMKKSILADPTAKALLRGEHEQPYFWRDEMTGEECKCRVDSINHAHRIITDIKTAADASTEAFMRDSIKYGYDLQAYMYSDGVQVNTGKTYDFYFVVIEKTPPYAINILRADEYFKMRGGDLFRHLIGMYHICKESNDWYGLTGFSKQPNILTLPPHLLKDYKKGNESQKEENQ